MSAIPGKDHTLDSKDIFGEIVSELNEPSPAEPPVTQPSPTTSPPASASKKQEHRYLEAVPVATTEATDPEAEVEAVSSATPAAEPSPPEASADSQTEPTDPAETPEVAEVAPAEKETQPDSEPSAQPGSSTAPEVDRTATAPPANDHEIARWVETTVSLLQKSASRTIDRTPSPDDTQAWIERSLHLASAATEPVGETASPTSPPTESRETEQGQAGDPEEVGAPESATESEESAKKVSLLSAEEIREAQGEVRFIEKLRARKMLVAAVIVGLLAGLLITILATRLLHGTWLPRSPDAAVREQTTISRTADEPATNPIPPPPLETYDFVEALSSEPVPERPNQTDEFSLEPPPEPQ